MKNKYNLALTPTSKNKEFITLSQQFSAIADKYLLGNNSLPHVTLYQFEVDEKEIENTWKHTCDIWEEKPINLEFSKFSCITFDNNTYWVSLLPNNCDALHKMHSIIADIIKLPIKKNFDPHVTLISSKNKDYEKEADEISHSYTPITDTFILTLGKSDEMGQLTGVIYKDTHDLH